MNIWDVLKNENDEYKEIEIDYMNIWDILKNGNDEIKRKKLII